MLANWWILGISTPRDAEGDGFVLRVLAGLHPIAHLAYQVAADPKKKFKWPTPTYADGSVRDY